MPRRSTGEIDRLAERIRQMVEDYWRNPIGRLPLQTARHIARETGIPHKTVIFIETRQRRLYRKGEVDWMLGGRKRGKPPAPNDSLQRVRIIYRSARLRRPSEYADRLRQEQLSVVSAARSHLAENTTKRGEFRAEKSRILQFFPTNQVERIIEDYERAYDEVLYRERRLVEETERLATQTRPAQPTQDGQVA